MPLLELLSGSATQLALGSITVDVSMSEDHSLTAEITDSPIERGSDVSDHRRLKPAVLRLRGVVTDTPDGFLAAGEAVAAGIAGGSRSKDAYAELEEQFSQHEPIAVVTDLKVYDQMLWESLTVHRDGETGRALAFEGVLREVFFAESEVVEVAETKVDSAAPTKKVGTKAGKAAKVNDTRSAAAKIRDGAAAGVVDKLKSFVGL